MWLDAATQNRSSPEEKENYLYVALYNVDKSFCTVCCAVSIGTVAGQAKTKRGRFNDCGRQAQRGREHRTLRDEALVTVIHS